MRTVGVKQRIGGYPTSSSLRRALRAHEHLRNKPQDRVLESDIKIKNDFDTDWRHDMLSKSLGFRWIRINVGIVS